MSIDEAGQLLRNMLSLQNAEIVPLRSQLNVLAIQDTPDGNFRLTPQSGEEHVGQHGVYVDAEATDLDGETVYALLHVSSGRLSELQLFRGDGDRVQKELRADDFAIVTPLKKPKLVD